MLYNSVSSVRVPPAPRLAVLVVDEYKADGHGANKEGNKGNQAETHGFGNFVDLLLLLFLNDY
jgi:hypothetical protein